MNDPVHYVDAPPPEGQKITELFAWIATYANGGEGIISVDMNLPWLGDMPVKRHIPLITSKRHIAENMHAQAHAAQHAAAYQAGEMVRIKMKHFRLVEDAST